MYGYIYCTGNIHILYKAIQGYTQIGILSGGERYPPLEQLGREVNKAVLYAYNYIFYI